MKKQFIIFLILIFILGLAPVNFSEAITQNQISSEVQIVCTDGADSWFSGSGTIIDPKGIILTNRHVVEGAYKNICFIGFLESINKEPDFGPDSDPYLAEVKYITTTKDMDAAVLYLDNKSNKTFPYVNIWSSNSNSLKFGDKIEVVGYPGIGGSTITYTSGDFSGFGSQSDGTQNYVKTTALLEHGNSGGSAYNQRGEFVGIPSMVVTGSLNSISYVLSVDSIKKWLSGFLGGDYKQEIIAEEPKIIEEPKIDLQNDITPPYLKDFGIGFFSYDENGVKISGRELGTSDHTTTIDPWNRLKFYWYENCSGTGCINDNSGLIKGYYYYFGKNSNANPQKDGKYISSTELVRETVQKTNYCVNPNVCDINPFPPITRVSMPNVLTINQAGNNYFILQAVDGNNNISNPLINYEYVYEGMEYKELKAIEIYDQNKKKIAESIYSRELVDSAGSGFDMSFEILSKYKTLYLRPDYGFPTNGVSAFIKKGETCSLTRCEGGQKYSDGLIKWNSSDGNLIFLKPYFKDETNIYAVKHLVLNIKYQANNQKPLSIGKYSKIKLVLTNKEKYSYDTNFSNKMKGHILLQVEAGGQAWYINPANGRKYYMANGDEALKVMRNFGIGIKNADLEKIQLNKNFAKNFSGKIMLQVESRGEAYYIDFNGNTHYLKDGAAAYGVMRKLGLGITNNDLSKIPEGSL